MNVRVVKYGWIPIAKANGRIDGTSACGFEAAFTSTVPAADQDMICDLSGGFLCQWRRIAGDPDNGKTVSETEFQVFDLRSRKTGGGGGPDIRLP